jgi:hypothetical protein
MTGAPAPSKERDSPQPVAGEATTSSRSGHPGLLCPRSLIPTKLIGYLGNDTLWKVDDYGPLCTQVRPLRLPNHRRHVRSY